MHDRCHRLIKHTGASKLRSRLPKQENEYNEVVTKTGAPCAALAPYMEIRRILSTVVPASGLICPLAVAETQHRVMP